MEIVSLFEHITNGYKTSINTRISTLSKRVATSIMTHAYLRQQETLDFSPTTGDVEPQLIDDINAA